MTTVTDGGGTARGMAAWWSGEAAEGPAQQLLIHAGAAGAARRQARRFHTALAELVRRHDRALTQVRITGEYDAVTASLRAGVLTLVAGVGRRSCPSQVIRSGSAQPDTPPGLG
ncbi:hypothetical protein [Streptomyces sp. NRRL S-1022]|uniref:hypothetical protein n=1 Tax=Streptomyces sp. NRRL S-1022 TaxID=1463880 RepID=UPI0004C1AA7F|nr:hypothetical protein [Streptomyces sp. NRRL S-1022]